MNPRHPGAIDKVIKKSFPSFTGKGKKNIWCLLVAVHILSIFRNLWIITMLSDNLKVKANFVMLVRWESKTKLLFTSTEHILPCYKGLAH